MFKIFSYLKILDEKFFNLITELKNNEQYQNLNQKILSLDEGYQRLVQFFAFSLTLFLPLFTLAGLFLIIFSVTNRIDEKKQILELLDLQLSINKQVQNFNNTLISSLSLNSEEDLKGMVASNPMFSSINNKISYTNFSQTPLISNYKDSQITLKFNQISTPDLTNILKLLYEQYKARVVQASINRSPQNKLIQGEISVNIISN
jgi:hypothetical protein